MKITTSNDPGIERFWAELVRLWDKEREDSAIGYYKQLHIDCYQDNCLVNQEETCYMQKDNVSYYDEGDYNALMDEDLEGYDSTTTSTQEKDARD